MSDDRAHIELLITVARRYWIDGASQAVIASELGYDRSMISRLLSECRKLGVVSFSVGHPLERAIELEQALRSRFGLQKVRVALNTASTDSSEAARLAAELLRDAVPPDGVVAVTNGHAVSTVVAALHPARRPHATVVQAIGAVARDNHIVDSPELCQQAAHKLGSRYRLLPAPLLVNSAVATALMAEDTLSMTLAMASHADVLLTGIGRTSAHEDGVIFEGFVNADEHAELLAAGAVGHICGHHFNTSGEHVDAAFCQRLIAIPFDRITEIRTVIAVAWGRAKTQAIRAALRGHLVDELVTDLETASLLMDG